MTRAKVWVFSFQPSRMKTEPRVLSARLYMPVTKMRPSGATAKSKGSGSERVMDLPGAQVRVWGFWAGFWDEDGSGPARAARMRMMKRSLNRFMRKGLDAEW